MSLTIPTVDELYAAGQAEAQARRPGLVDWTAGSVLDALTGSGAVLADEVIRIAIDRFATQFVDTASGEDLDALAMDRFGLERNAAAPSVGSLEFTRGSSSGTLTIPAGTTCRATVNGRSVTFETDAEAQMLATDTTVDVPATCTETGPSGNVAEDTVTVIVDAIPGDASATVTNPDRFAGGAEEEGDAAFRDRIRRYFQTLRKGTVAALEAGALSVPGVAAVTVDESFIAAEDGGYVAVYVGDPDGRANATLAADVEVELENWRAAGVRVEVTASSRDEVELTVELFVAAGSDTSTITADARAAVLAYTDALAPNARLYFSAVEAAAIGVSTRVKGAVATSTDGTGEYLEPAAAHQALRVNASDLTVTVTEV